MATRKKDTAPEAAESTATPEAPAPTCTKATTVCKAAIRRKPDGPVIGTIPAGTPVTVVERRGGFARLSNGVFVNEDLLKQ